MCLVRNASNSFASTATYTSMRACTIAQVVRASGNPSQLALRRDDQPTDTRVVILVTECHARVASRYRYSNLSSSGIFWMLSILVIFFKPHSTNTLALFLACWFLKDGIMKLDGLLNKENILHNFHYNL